MTTRTRPDSIAERYVVLVAGEAFSKACVFVAFAYLARVLGPAQFGLITLALSSTFIAVMMVDGGFGNYGAKVVASDRSQTPRTLAGMTLLRGALAIVCYVVLLSLWLAFEMPAFGLLAVYGLSVFSVPFFNHWVFQGLGRMRWFASAGMLRNFVFVTCIFATVHAGSDLRLVAVSELAGLVVFGGFVTFAVSRWAGIGLDLRGAQSSVKNVLREVSWLGGAQAAWVIMWYSPALVLGMVTTPETVAWLAGSVQIVQAIHTFVMLYYVNLLPKIVEAVDESVEAWRALTRRSLTSSSWVACLIALGGFLLAPVIVTVTFGSQYEAAATSLQILVWLIPIAWLVGHFRSTLIACGLQRLHFWATLAGTTVTVALAWWLSPIMGSTGAAIALLAGGGTDLTLEALAVPRHLRADDTLTCVAVPIAACAGCVVVGLVLDERLGLVLASATAVAIYGAIALKRDSELATSSLAWLRR